MLYASKGECALFTGQREREIKREREKGGRERKKGEREKEGRREREREKERIFISKRNDGCLGTF